MSVTEGGGKQDGVMVMVRMTGRMMVRGSENEMRMSVCECEWCECVCV